MTNTELKALIKLLRTQGVSKYSTPELTLELSLNIGLKTTSKHKTKESDHIDTPDALTDEQLLFWSSTGLSEEKTE